MVSLISLLNRLLPFASEGTPLIVDIVHLIVLCAALYYAPQIQDRLQRQNSHDDQGEPQHPDPIVEGDQDADTVPARVVNEEPDELRDAEPPLDRDNERQDQPQQWVADEGLDDGQPGPADARDIPAQRNVGAKKAKSLARRDQRRAYNEFMRSQGEAQRARDAEGAEEREKALAAERERRKAATTALEAKKAHEREKRREQERKEREAENRRREQTVSLVRGALEERRVCNLFDVAKQVGGDADEVWVEKILNASGLLKNSNGLMTMVTTTGWVVRVGADDMAKAYSLAVSSVAASDSGIVTYEELGGVIERVIKEVATP